MFIGVPKEIKTDEYRVALIPPVVFELTSRGHRVAVESGAGQGAGIGDDEYAAAGARIYADADRIFEEADLIVKVKEPLAPERQKLRRGQIVFTYLHLAADPDQARDLLQSGVTAIAYETVTDFSRKTAAACPDVPGGGAHGAAGGCAFPGTPSRRTRHPVWRRRRRPLRPSPCFGGRGGGLKRCGSGHWHGRRCRPRCAEC